MSIKCAKVLSTRLSKEPLIKHLTGEAHVKRKLHTANRKVHTVNIKVSVANFTELLIYPKREC